MCVSTLGSRHLEKYLCMSERILCIGSVSTRKTNQVWQQSHCWWLGGVRCSKRLLGHVSWWRYLARKWYALFVGTGLGTTPSAQMMSHGKPSLHKRARPSAWARHMRVYLYDHCFSFSRSDTSLGKVFISILQNSILWIKLFRKYLIQVWKRNYCRWRIQIRPSTWLTHTKVVMDVLWPFVWLSSSFSFVLICYILYFGTHITKPVILPSTLYNLFVGYFDPMNSILLVKINCRVGYLTHESATA